MVQFHPKIHLLCEKYLMGRFQNLLLVSQLLQEQIYQSQCTHLRITIIDIMIFLNIQKNKKVGVTQQTIDV